MSKKKEIEESDALLWPLVDKAAELRREYRRRNPKFDQRRVKPADQDQAEAEGWALHKRLKGAVSMRRERSIAERLENVWWVLLYKMGYRELSAGRNFRISFQHRNAVAEEAHIDVYASDDETVIIAKCRSCERLRKQSMAKDLHEISSVKGDVSKSIKAFYGPDFKPKILWFAVTENVIWSEDDLKLAKEKNINVATENELPYYTQLAEHLGKAARFQFLAEFLKDQSIPELAGTKVPATRGKLGGKYFYSFVTTPRHLLKIAFVNHRTLDDPDGQPSYQRLIQKSRLRAVGNFIEHGGYFPNNLLINFVKNPRFDIIQKDLHADVHFGHLYLPNSYKSAWIIDGQHRLYGYAGLGEEYLDHKLVVVAFEGVSKEEEANMFVTINHEQKSVPKNLLDDLEGQLKWESDNPSERIGALAARLIHNLNRDLSSPLYSRFSAEGIKASPSACLTVPQVKLGLRRSKLLGEVVLRTHYELGPLCSSSDNSTLVRAQKVFSSYLRQVSEADLTRWESGRPGKLCTNEGVQALTLLLAEIIRHIQKSVSKPLHSLHEVKLTEAILPLLAPILNFIAQKGPDVDRMLNVPFGSGGPKELFLRFSRIIRLEFNEFEPDGYDDWEKAQSDDLRRNADQQIQQINILVQKHIFSVFRRLYGDERNSYWEKGVTNKDMKTKAYGKSLDEPDEELPLETYLDFIDFKKIVESRDRWPLFKDVMDIPIEGVKGQAKNLEWMERVNGLRRIPAHAAEQRNYKGEDFAFLDRVYGLLDERIGAFRYEDLGLIDEK
ncbi:DGQHR domain-containing protein [Xanthomonas translucens]|uniref:DGQHR domain-containing protein n=1 Tax=Xanthomonas campestris pv. translucens TaxID=343 RepID=UPI0009BF19C7|nr:DGQHR domain-containing protein [Xanthomonas translucens]WLA04443.1 DGQHR domain-containing protein [Xanthomonas translucens]